MTTTEIKPAVTKEACDLRQRALIALITSLAQGKPEVHHRIAAHFRAITDGKHGNIATYHISPTIDLATKYEEYARISSALGLTRDAAGKPRIGQLDWSKLQGSIGNGARVIEPEEPPAVVTKRVDPLAGVLEVESEDHGEPDVPVAVAPRSVRQLVSSPAAGQEDDLATIIARHLEGKMRAGVPQAAPIDDGIVRLIVAEELQKLDIAAAVKKANGNGAFPTERVQKLIADALATAVQRIEIVMPNGDTKPLEGLMHPQVPQAATWLMAGVPVWKFGGAGAGKTHLARQIATILDVTPYVISVDPTLTVAKLLGYRNVANGEFVEGFLYKPYKLGGLAALDEVDTGDPGVIASLNAMVSNAHYLFPNGETVDRHAKFHVLALANTKGTGAVAGYTARNRLDAATLDRFAIIELKYDEGLEKAIACGTGTA